MNGKIYSLLDGVRNVVFNPYCKFLNAVVNACHNQTVEGLGEGHSLYIVTVAYNRADLIRTQIRLLKKNLLDKDYVHFVVDNSSDFKVRSAIEAVCRQENVVYLSVPKSFYHVLFPKLFWYGISQGMAINWFCRKVLPSIPPSQSIAFLDHDLFPLREYSLSEHLANKPFYGVERLRAGRYYLWSGFAMFDNGKVKPSALDFMPRFIDKVFYDAGGSNCLTVFNHYAIQKDMFASADTYLYNKKSGGKNDDVYHRDCFQIIDKAWIHLINGSNYARLKGKEEIMQNVLNHLDDIARKL